MYNSTQTKLSKPRRKQRRQGRGRLPTRIRMQSIDSTNAPANVLAASPSASLAVSTSNTTHESSSLVIPGSSLASQNESHDIANARANDTTDSLGNLLNLSYEFLNFSFILYH